MTELDWISFIAIAEFAGILVLALGFVFYLAMRSKKRDSHAATDLVKKVQSEQPERRSALEGLLAASRGLEGDELKKESKRLIELEERLYEHIIRTYLTRDSAALLEIDDKFKSVLAPYLELGGSKSAAPAATPVSEGETNEAEAAGNNAGDERLRERLNKLSEDLILYRDTLNRVFSEYTAMFGVHIDSRQQLSAQEIMHRLDTGELAGSEEEEPAAAGDEASDGSAEKA